ncbi:Na+/H+ antiporter NhaA [Paramicrobacterium agarici]|uniref:Na(+)/H(+) antiporter NhaA n=1 Tax=Paramicrobacterium agarici TaxID=630514 RepID=A0A2A9DZG9_9MICO|nr:Na+/H+ antiporter NhaA [Microbacterium agarici]PFG31721.1 sodium/proton antiporter (NhaA family) [Microbacterium agarici]
MNAPQPPTTPAQHPDFGLTVITRSPDPTQSGATPPPRPPLTERIQAMGQSRLGALLLLVATIIAVIWANVSYASYEQVWGTHLVIGLEDLQLNFTLHAFVNDAIMAVFFFTVGLEVRREFAIGELTTWSRAMVPVAAAIAGLAVPALLYVIIATGTGAEEAWGVVISTDTAFLVGALALVGPRAPGRLRVFLLAMAVVDDIGALAIIALIYTDDLQILPLAIAAVGLAGIFFTRYLRAGRGPTYGILSVIVWLAFLASGVHPTLAGVAIALLVPVYRPNRRDVEHALSLTQTFRQSPNSQYARAAANSLRESISINERLQSAYAPVIAYAIIPLFALANAGVRINGEILADAVRSPIMWAIVVGLVVGKFVGIFGMVWLTRVFRVGSLGPGLTLRRIAGGSLLSGIGFTISLFIVGLAISDTEVQNIARVGVLTASVIAFAASALFFRISERSTPSSDIGHTLVRPVDPARDHVYGPEDAPYTLVEYGDFQCEFCLKATGAVREVQRELGDNVRYVWRHAPLSAYHPNAVAAAEASEAAFRQGKFGEFMRSLFADQEHQQPADMLRRADELGLDIDRFESDLNSAEVAARVRDDAFDAEAMEISAVPTFFVNGVRHVGPFDAASLIRALESTPPSSAHSRS